VPQQEVFLHEDRHGVVTEVLKTYDRSYAREVFGGIGDDAKRALAEALEINANYDLADIPSPDSSDFDDLLWEELSEAAREDVRQDPNLYSYFIVTQSKDGNTEELYVSPDWPSAEIFARSVMESRV
jgi:hypothetical protein